MEAAYRLVGLKCPDTCPDVSSLRGNLLPINDILVDASVVMTSETCAWEGLTAYICYLNGVTNREGDFRLALVTKILAMTLLKELGIDSYSPLTQQDIHAIIKKLQLYPIDYY